jgi:hypothetical protein
MEKLKTESFKGKTKKVDRLDIMVPVIIQEKVKNYLVADGHKNHALKMNLDKCMWFVGNLVNVKGRREHSFEKKTGLSGEILHRYLGVDGTKYVKKVLTETGIIVIDHHHSRIHGRSKSYGFTKGLFDGELSEYRVTSRKLISMRLKDTFGEYKENLEQDSFLNIEKYSIDYAVYQFIKDKWMAGELTPMQYMCHYLRAKEIDFKDFYVHRDEDGRLYTNFTSLPKIMRPFISLDGVRIVLREVDVSACMAFILGILLQRDWFSSKDTDLFIKMSQEPDFYAKMASYIGYESTDLKTEFLTMLNAKNGHRTVLPIYNKFIEKFPNVADFINETNEENQANLYHACIKIESKVMVDMAYGRLMSYSRKAFGIHDGILVEPQDVDLASRLIRKGFREEFGSEPVIKVK